MMDGRIHDAVLSGNSSSLLALLQDATALPADADGNTPLHSAGLYGKLDAVRQLVKLIPRSVKLLNKQQSSPLHLAVDLGHRRVAEELLKVDSEICFYLDENGLSPVHIAARKDQVPVLRAMLAARPMAALQLTARGENVLHMCAKLNRLEALELLVKSNEVQDHFINFQDGYKNTALHIATVYRNIEVINFLVGHPKVDVDARNLAGLTALQALLHSRCIIGDDDIEEIFQG